MTPIRTNLPAAASGFAHITGPVANADFAAMPLALDTVALGTHESIAVLKSAAVQQDQEVVDRAVAKMTMGIDLLKSMMKDGLTNDSRQLVMRALDSQNDRKRVDADIQRSAHKIEEAATKRKKQIQEQFEAQEAAKGWGFFGKILRVVAMAVSAVAAVVSGGALAIAAAAICVAGFAASEAGAPKWLSMSLAIGGALLGCGSGLVNSTALVGKHLLSKATQVALKAALRVIEGGVKVAQGVGKVGEGINAYEAAQCDVKIQNADTDKKEAEHDRDKAQEIASEFPKALHEMMMRMLRIMDLRHSITATAMGQR
jgi:hypothetical protein